MKNIAFFVLFLFVVPFFVSAQTSIDTISAYDVAYEITKSGGKATYKIDGKKASKEDVDAIVEANKKKNNCAPCFLINLDVDKKIRSTGLYYAKCAGKTEEAEINIEGNSQTQFYKDASCKDGEWHFYNANGELIETKYYNLGEEVKSPE